MGPGTYFLRVILEGGRGDNMRDIASNKKKNLTSDNSEGESGDGGQGGGESGGDESEREGERDSEGENVSSRERDGNGEKEERLINVNIDKNKTDKTNKQDDKEEREEREDGNDGNDGNDDNVDVLKMSVQKELEHEEDFAPTVEAKKVLSLAEHGDIKRIIFCSGKARTCHRTVQCD
jgi:hypothetical protein